MTTIFMFFFPQIGGTVPPSGNGTEILPFPWRRRARR